MMMMIEITSIQIVLDHFFHRESLVPKLVFPIHNFTIHFLSSGVIKWLLSGFIDTISIFFVSYKRCIDIQNLQGFHILKRCTAKPQSPPLDNRI